MRLYWSLAILGGTAFISTMMMASNIPSMPLQIINKSGLNNNKIYFTANGVLPESGHNCFFKFDEKGQGECLDIEINQTPYYYNLADFAGKDLYIPAINSGRLYISLGYPMVLYTMGEPGALKISSVDGFNPRDPNFYTLHDKVEFSNAFNGFFINPTAVDFFTLPLEITNPKASPPLQSAGLTQSQQDIFARAYEMMGSDEIFTTWQNLFVNFNNDKNQPLRLMATNKAMVDNTLPEFDLHYLDNDAYGFNYTDFVWEYYEAHTLKIDVKELNPNPPNNNDDYLFEGKVDPKNPDVIVFKSNLETIELKKPSTSIPFFAGDTDTFQHDPDKPAKSVIVRDFTAAFNAGLLPAPSGDTLSKDYFKQNQSSFYTDNPIIQAYLQAMHINTPGPWYDLYSKILHSWKDPIYTFAYDDILGQDGTIHVDGDVVTPTTITIGEVNPNIPNPYTKKTYEKVEMIVAATPDVQVYYKDQLLTGAHNFTNITTPLWVTVNGDDVQIYIEHPMALVDPYTVNAQNIVIEETSETTARIIFPGSWE